MEQFENLSDLAGNSQKNEVFCAAVPDGLKNQIFEILQFKRASILVRYLEVHLISGSPCAKECMPLLEITGRNESRQQGIFTLQNGSSWPNQFIIAFRFYWSSIFLLPKKIFKPIEQKFSSYLWKGKEI